VHTLLVFVELLAASIWVGGFVAIGVASRVARTQLGPSARVTFFRALGRSYLRVGGGALAVALLAGAVLLTHGGWGAGKSAAVAIGAILVGVTAVAVRQARAINRLRTIALAGTNAAGAAADRRRRSATCLRAAIGLLTISELVAASLLIR